MKNNLLNLKKAFLALGILVSGVMNAFTAVTSGNWSSAATWGGTAPGGSVSNADIIIPAGITVTMDMDVVFSGLLNSVNVNGQLTTSTSNGLIIQQGTLIGSGVVSITRLQFGGITTTAFTGTINVNKFINASSITLGFVAVANITDSLILEAGTLNLNANSNLSMMTGSTIRLNNGSLGINGGIFNSANNYNVLYVGTSKTTGVELNSSTMQNLMLNLNSNSESVTLSANTNVAANLNMMVGRLNLNGRKLTLNGDIMLSSGTAFVSTATSELEVAGTGTLTNGLTFNSNAVIDNLIINRSGASVSLNNNVDIDGELHLRNGNLVVQSGATLDMNAGSKIVVESGVLSTNTGVFSGVAAYDVEYMGANSYTAGIEIRGSGLEDVTVNYSNASGKVSLTNSLTVAGELSVDNGHLALNGYNVFLNGTLSQNASGVIDGHSASELHLNLSSAANSTLFLDGANQELSRLRVNIAGASELAIGSGVTIVNELAFVAGRIMIMNNDLIIQSAASITGYSDKRYVATSLTGTGRLQMNVTAGSSYVTFPVGTLNNYSPAHIQQTASGTSGNFMVRTINDVMINGTSGPNSGSLARVERTWFIESTTTVNMNLKLGWMVASEVSGFDRTNAMIRHYTNAAWDTYATASATAGANSTFELSRTGITSLSPFAVVDNTAPLKVNEITNDLSFEVFPNPAKDQLSIKVNGTNAAYKYELYDLTGRSVGSGDLSKKLDVSDLQSGYYFVKITDISNNTSGIKRFVKN